MPPLDATKATKILIVGANGNLGQALLRQIGTTSAIAVTRRPEWAAGDFRHYSIATDLGFSAIPWSEIHAIINVAGSVHGTPSELEDANINLPIKLAETARVNGVRHFIQLSSFSVYGKREQIDSFALECPINAYGESKLACDHKLLSMNSEKFAVSILRVPFMFDAEHPALFGPLFQAIRLLPFFPVAQIATKRSMISYADSARVLYAISQNRMQGVLHASAIEQFDYKLLETILQEEAKIDLRLMRLPHWLTKFISLAAPNLARRLFRSSTLHADLNIAANLPDLEGLHPPLRALVKRQFLVHLPTV